MIGFYEIKKRLKNELAEELRVAAFISDIFFKNWGKSRNPKDVHFPKRIMRATKFTKGLVVDWTVFELSLSVEDGEDASHLKKSDVITCAFDSLNL